MKVLSKYYPTTWEEILAQSNKPVLPLIPKKFQIPEDPMLLILNSAPRIPRYRAPRSNFNIRKVPICSMFVERLQGFYREEFFRNAHRLRPAALDRHVFRPRIVP